MLRHLIVKPYDPSLEYVKFAKKAFGENKCLLMLEKKGGDHLHIQGLTNFSEKEFDQIQSEILTANHYRKKEDSKTHPVKKRKREADEVGFQYMCKELLSSIVIYKQGFTNEDLEELHASSNAHREELKSQLGEYITGSVNRGDGETPQVLHKRIARAAVKYYVVEDKMQPPNLRLLVRHVLVTKYTSDDVIDYCADLIM